eukprot:Blabericola_migrator_1__54@NODE_1011_length_5710_cov_146_189615_g538_i1_p2_GENE_NODE_1011_length_5710_cov_146_189615_g538_i1NODE_1011_length_5710_cov_146_189615_g538_i1_p2_ORF_typecomplete_len446_score14_26_NODE_1011_length_5710_cov_146_189615_g538_i142675604
MLVCGHTDEGVSILQIILTRHVPLGKVPRSRPFFPSTTPNLKPNRCRLTGLLSAILAFSLFNITSPHEIVHNDFRSLYDANPTCNQCLRLYGTVFNITNTDACLQTVPLECLYRLDFAIYGVWYPDVDESCSPGILGLKLTSVLPAVSGPVHAKRGSVTLVLEEGAYPIDPSCHYDVYMSNVHTCPVIPRNGKISFRPLGLRSGNQIIIHHNFPYRIKKYLTLQPVLPATRTRGVTQCGVRIASVVFNDYHGQAYVSGRAASNWTYSSLHVVDKPGGVVCSRACWERNTRDMLTTDILKRCAARSPPSCQFTVTLQLSGVLQPKPKESRWINLDLAPFHNPIGKAVGNSRGFFELRMTGEISSECQILMTYHKDDSVDVQSKPTESQKIDAHSRSIVLEFKYDYFFETFAELELVPAPSALLCGKSLLGIHTHLLSVTAFNGSRV